MFALCTSSLCKFARVPLRGTSFHTQIQWKSWITMGTKVIFETWAAPSKRRFTVTDRTHEYSITMGFPLCRLSRDECAIIRRRILLQHMANHFVRSVGKRKNKTEKFKRIIKVIQSYDCEKYFKRCIYTYRFVKC